MFKPIKDLITYIQKNASGGSSLFGNSSSVSTSEEAAKMEAENLTSENNCANTDSMMERSEALGGSDIAVKDNDKVEHTSSLKSTNSDLTENVSSLHYPAADISSTSEAATEEEDIEAQLDTSIMLKKPVKHSTTKGTEILELKKSPNALGRSIYISHDYNRNHASDSPSVDELEDFRHDPTAVRTSSPVIPQYNPTTVAVSNESENTTEDAEDQYEECKSETENSKIANDTFASEDCETVDGQASILLTESEDEHHADATEVQSVIELDEDAEDTYLDLDNFPDSEVVVLNDTTPNTSLPLDTSSTSDDPLAIAFEEHAAFEADRAAALEELNLLNTATNSQDEDTRTTVDDDLQWLRVETNTAEGSELPSCSKSMDKPVIVANGATPEKEERNGEGSDSGLGSETSALHITNSSIGDTSHISMTASGTPTPPRNVSGSEEQSNEVDSGEIVVPNMYQSPGKSLLKESPRPLRSNLKRRLEVDDDIVHSLGTLASSSATCSLTTSTSSMSGSVHKKLKRSINFDNVQVFYFPRQQGFSCVPSAGGCTLGMGARHVGFKTLTLAEHAAELRRAHRMQLQEINPRGSSSDDSEESEEDYLSEGSGSDLDGESNGFLQPVSPKQRRAILKAAGIRKIDASEKAECRDIRNSREVCGCTCRDFCDPETCACSQSGIKCQVDRDMFPCGCSRDACGNTIGRVEFNPARVRTHYIHTLMRLEMENRQQQNPYSSAVPSVVTAAASSYYQSAHMQPQSNYSSGYASPAYNSSASTEIHQQVAASSYYMQQTSSNPNSLYAASAHQSHLEKLLANGTTSVPGASTSTYGGMDGLDSGLFGNTGAAVTPSYGELMSASSYHHSVSYENVQTQVSAYSTYHSSGAYMNTNNSTNLNTLGTYSSCSVPSVPPYGSATTTEATGDYHIVNSMSALETTAAPSCSNAAPAIGSAVEPDDGSSFICLSTPTASSSRLSQINDLLQHNRNATTALVAVSQSLGTQTAPANNANINTAFNSASLNTPPIEDAQKSCMAYDNLTSPPPLRSAPIVSVVDVEEGGPNKPSDPPPPPKEPPPSTQSATLSATDDIIFIKKTIEPNLDAASITSPMIPIMPGASVSAPLLVAAKTDTGPKPVEEAIYNSTDKQPTESETLVTTDVSAIKVAAGN